MPLFRHIVEAHSEFDGINEARFLQAQCLSATRALEECIDLCRENLKVAPEASEADYWRFLIPRASSGSGDLRLRNPD